MHGAQAMTAAARSGVAVLLYFSAAVACGAVDAARSPSLAQQAQVSIERGRLHQSRQQFAAAREQLNTAVHLFRREGGLYDQRQYPVLAILVEVDASLGRVAQAAGHLRYMERISENAYGTRSVQHAQALMELADYYCRLGEFFDGRRRHRAAIEAADALGTDEAQLIQALLGLARCALRELSAQGIATSATPLEEYLGPIERSMRTRPGEITFRYHTQKQLNYEAESALTRAAELASGSQAVPVELAVATLLHAGDWFQIKDHLDKARGYYAKARRASIDRGLADSDTVLAAPVRILYPVPAFALRSEEATADRATRSIVIEFTVAPNGTVHDESIIRRDAGKSMVDAAMAAVRSARYRPRFSGDKPVATEQVRSEERFAAPADRIR